VQIGALVQDLVVIARPTAPPRLRVRFEQAEAFLTGRAATSQAHVVWSAPSRTSCRCAQDLRQHQFVEIIILVIQSSCQVPIPNTMRPKAMM